MNILEQIIATKQQEVAAARKQKSLAALEAEATATTRRAYSLRAALLGSQTGIIAEFKRKSPSKGFIKEHAEISAITPGYAQAGAAALSILTDRDYFAGNLNDLQTARPHLSIPILRKDFIIDPYQICQARIAGADAILLIAAALTPGQVERLAAYAHALGLEVMLEIHLAEELDALCNSVDVVGVNNRDLTTFHTDPAQSFALIQHIPQQFVTISESGLTDPQTVAQLRQAGFNGFLMGERFMKTSNPAAALQTFIQELTRCSSHNESRS